MLFVIGCLRGLRIRFGPVVLGKPPNIVCRESFWLASHLSSCPCPQGQNERLDSLLAAPPCTQTQSRQNFAPICPLSYYSGYCSMRSSVCGGPPCGWSCHGSHHCEGRYRRIARQSPQRLPRWRSLRDESCLDSPCCKRDNSCGYQPGRHLSVDCIVRPTVTNTTDCGGSIFRLLQQW